MAITRITGEEDVHGIENAEDIEEEISFCLMELCSLMTCQAVSAGYDEFHCFFGKSNSMN